MNKNNKIYFVLISKQEFRKAKRIEEKRKEYSKEIIVSSDIIEIPDNMGHITVKIPDWHCDANLQDFAFI